MLILIHDTIFCKIYLIKFVIFLTSFNFLSILKVKGKMYNSLIKILLSFPFGGLYPLEAPGHGLGLGSALDTTVSQSLIRVLGLKS